MLLLTGEAFAHIIVHGEDFVGRVYGRDSAFLVYLYINFGWQRWRGNLCVCMHAIEWSLIMTLHEERLILLHANTYHHI